MIRLEGMERRYVSDEVETTALADMDVSVERGEFAIVGPSGCGKSTLLDTLGTVDGPTAAISVRWPRPCRARHGARRAGEGHPRRAQRRGRDDRDGRPLAKPRRHGEAPHRHARRERSRLRRERHLAALHLHGRVS